MQARAEIITTQVLLFEVELGEGMRAVHDCFNAFCTGYFANSFHRCDLASDVDLMRDQDKPGALRDSFFKCSGDLLELFRRNGNLDQLQFKAFSLLTLPQRGQHARIILGGGENFVAGLEVHASQQDLERLRSVARDRDLFAVAAEELC